MIYISVKKVRAREMVSCRVLALFDKHYNKWFFPESGQKKWRADLLKSKFCVLVRLIQYYQQFREHRDVDPMNVEGFGVNEVYFMEYLQNICGVEGNFDSVLWKI